MSIMLALLVLRVTVGAFMFVHGAQKLLGWFDGKGLRGAMDTVGRRGLRPAWIWGPVAAAVMSGGAALTTLGLLSPLGPIGIAACMLTVVTIDSHKGFFAHQGGNEHAWLYLASAVVLALAGPGDYSIDALLGIALPPTATAVAVALAALGGGAAVVSRDRDHAVRALARRGELI